MTTFAEVLSATLSAEGADERPVLAALERVAVRWGVRHEGEDVPSVGDVLGSERSLPEFLEVAPDSFVGANLATRAHVLGALSVASGRARGGPSDRYFLLLAWLVVSGAP